MYYNLVMKNVLFFTIYILFFAVMSSLIFSILYMQFDEQPILALNKAIKYGAILLCALFIVPILKIKSLYNRILLGYLESKSNFIYNIMKGFFLSLILLLPLLIFFNIANIRKIDANINIFNIDFFYSLLFAFFISFIISLVEESFFRGILIQKNKNAKISSIINIIIFSSFVYSLFHFIKIPLIIEDEILWSTGLIKLIDAFSNFHKLVVIDSAITLIIFGIFLGVIRIYYNTISYGIGIHAGFVFTIKIYKQNSSVDFESEYNFLLGSYDHFTGHLASTWIATLLFIYIIYLYKKNRSNP